MTIHLNKTSLDKIGQAVLGKKSKGHRFTQRQGQMT